MIIKKNIGKLAEKQGRKAVGLRVRAYDCQVAFLHKENDEIVGSGNRCNRAGLSFCNEVAIM
jgi:hypothetical protein